MDDNPLLLDTNVLLTASTPTRALHQTALAVLNSTRRLCISGQIVREYLAVATRSVEENGLGLECELAVENIERILARVTLLTEVDGAVRSFLKLLHDVPCRGKQIHDANLVAVALSHGVRVILTQNVQHFRRFERWITIVELTRDRRRESAPG